MTLIKEEGLLEDKEMRQGLMNRLEVLEKVKELVTLDNTELMTTNLVANYYEVTEDVIRDNIRRHKEELESNGVKVMKYRDIKDMVNSEMFSLYKISKRGATVFSTRAILNMGMLLRDSVVAREVRNQLLNGFEKLSDKQKVIDIDIEDKLILRAVKSTSETDRVIAMSEYNNFHNRHKAELNARIEEMKPKEEAYDIYINSKGFQRMNDVAKSVGYGRNKLFQFLRDEKVLMKDNIPYESYITRGWFTVKQGVLANGSNNAQTFVSTKGINGISKLLKRSGVIE